jgi:MFS family permease
LSTDYWTLLLSVGLFGVGGPVISSGAPKVVSQLFTGSDRGFAMGVYMTGPAIGGVVSLTLTHSVLLPFFGGNWRSVLLLWACFCGRRGGDLAGRRPLTGCAPVKWRWPRHACRKGRCCANSSRCARCRSC